RYKHAKLARLELRQGRTATTATAAASPADWCAGAVRRRTARAIGLAHRVVERPRPIEIVDHVRVTDRVVDLVPGPIPLRELRADLVELAGREVGVVADGD